MRHSYKFTVLTGAIFSLLVLSSCGQKRSLYLPEEPETNSPTQHIKESSEGKN
ncbi:lipoprotein [Paraglaciecola sp. L3A3]|uniref:LPS translocon maturation chaperone LptM n=1 Tax=Paraglaciecola sp. L3A3 TaxID=2686358 RepID=UPI001E47FAEE|nr:lipoprotein [Paraglaciecola sp. L3A3]